MGFGNYSPELKTQLLAAVPAVALAANPSIVPGADILKIFDTGAWIGGPIVRERVWFFFFPRDQVLQPDVFGSYDSTGKQGLGGNEKLKKGSEPSWDVAGSARLFL